MNSIEFYTRYDSIAKDWAAFNATRKDMPDKDARVKEYELTQQTTQLFADYMGSQLDIQV